jgi:hypothetical protein
MQFAAFTQRTFLIASFLRVLSLPIAAETSRSTAARPKTLEWIYRIRYGFEDECFQTLRKIPACHPRAAEAAWLCARLPGLGASLHERRITLGLSRRHHPDVA